MGYAHDVYLDVNCEPEAFAAAVEDVRTLDSVDICIILSVCQTSNYLQNSGQRYWSSFAASPACTSDRKLIVSDSSRLLSG